MTIPCPYSHPAFYGNCKETFTVVTGGEFKKHLMTRHGFDDFLAGQYLKSAIDRVKKAVGMHRITVYDHPNKWGYGLCSCGEVMLHIADWRNHLLWYGIVEEPPKTHSSRDNAPCTGQGCPICADLAGLQERLDHIKEEAVAK